MCAFHLNPATENCGKPRGIPRGFSLSHALFSGAQNDLDHAVFFVSELFVHLWRVL